MEPKSLSPSIAALLMGHSDTFLASIRHLESLAPSGTDNPGQQRIPDLNYADFYIGVKTKKDLQLAHVTSWQIVLAIDSKNGSRLEN